MQYSNPAGNVPLGGVVLFSGAIVSIPTGYLICDGNNGTPDLRNRFVVGAGDTYAVDASGGADSVSHVSTNGDGFNIDPTGKYYLPHDNRPPYYSLAYIMRV